MQRDALRGLYWLGEDRLGSDGGNACSVPVEYQGASYACTSSPDLQIEMSLTDWTNTLKKYPEITDGFFRDTMETSLEYTGTSTLWIHIVW